MKRDLGGALPRMTFDPACAARAAPFLAMGIALAAAWPDRPGCAARWQE